MPTQVGNKIANVCCRESYNFLVRLLCACHPLLLG